jgi:RNA polymerase sigma factor (sigma-70 family)
MDKPGQAMGPLEDGSAAAAEQRLLANLDVVDAVVARTARRHRLSAAERDELASMVRLKLVDNGYEVVRRFEGRSSFGGYLTVVVERVLLDWRNARWGKWRPSAVARRLGPLALRLEDLLYRERCGFEDALAALRRIGVTESRESIAALADRLPPRTPHREVEEEAAYTVPTEGAVEEAVLDREAKRMAGRVERAIGLALAALSPRDRVVLKMHFIDGCRLSNVARALGVEQMPLYGRVQQSLALLRRHLEAEGVSSKTIGHLLEGDRLGSHLRLAQLFSGKKAEPRPSP